MTAPSSPLLLTRRQLLQRTGALAAALVLGEACGSTTSPSPLASRLATQPASLVPSATPTPGAPATLSADTLRQVLGNVTATGALTLPGGKTAQLIDLAAAGMAMAEAESPTANIVTDPVAGLGFVLACADWSGKTGAIDLGSVLPGLPLTPVRLVLKELPDGKASDLVAAASPPGLTLRQGAALLLAGILPDGRGVAGVADPARQVAGHPRLELALLAPATLAPLLALTDAALPAGGTTLALPGGTQVPLTPVDPDLATRLVAGAGVLFVDAVPLQLTGAKTPLLTADPVVPAPDPSVVTAAAKVTQGTDGRILARTATGTAVGRAEYIGGSPVWDWRGKDGLAWTLREEADRLGWHVGVEMTGGLFGQPKWQSIVRAQFNQVTIDWGFGWGDCEPSRGQFDFSIAQRQIPFPVSANDRIRGQALVLPAVLPSWVTQRSLSASEAKALLGAHVERVVGTFKGTVAEWVVVNEPYLNPYRPNDPFYSALGYDYIDIAFAAARQADPGAVLMYNDANNHASPGTKNGMTTALTRQTVTRLAAKSLVDRVGVQMHLDAADPPDPNDVTRTLQSYAVPVCITEFDIDLSRLPGTADDKYAQQARLAASMVKAVRDSGVCRSFTVWGIGDGSADRWANRPGAPPPMATSFTTDLKPKPFFQALLRGFA